MHGVLMMLCCIWRVFVLHLHQGGGLVPQGVGLVPQPVPFALIVHPVDFVLMAHPVYFALIVDPVDDIRIVGAAISSCDCSCIIPGVDIQIDVAVFGAYSEIWLVTHGRVDSGHT